METLQSKYRQEQKELQSRIMQKKKSATKKTRKSINDECESLERELKEKHSLEITTSQVGAGQISPPRDHDQSADSTHEPEAERSISNFEPSVGSIFIKTEPTPSSGLAKKPNRQKARLARRMAEQVAAAAQAAEEAAGLPNLRDQELEAMRGNYTQRNLKEKEIRPDGHCLYSAMADQLVAAGIDLKTNTEAASNSYEKAPSVPVYKSLRQVAASYIAHHQGDFTPFLDEPLEEYVRTIRDTAEWGGHLELMALAQAYKVTVNVLQSDGKVEKIECGEESSDKQLWLAYYRHSFGLGEHYNSLLRAS